MGLHRGRLLDHLQLVVKDLAASRRFYSAAFQVLGIPLGGVFHGPARRSADSVRIDL